MAGACDRLTLVDNVPTKRQLIVVVAHTALTLLLALAVILLLRRLSGGFRNPLGTAAIVLAAISLEFAAFCIRRMFDSSALFDSVLSTENLVLSPQHVLPGAIRSQLRFSMPDRLSISPADLATVAAILVITIAISIRGTSPVGLLIVWLIIIGTEIAQRLPQFNSLLPTLLPQRASPTPIAAGVPTDEITEPEIPPGLVQQMTRVVEDGRESIHGLLKADVAANDRVAIVHIAFCPPLCERPELSANAVDCDDTEIRLTQVESFGARLEARLPAASDAPRSLIIEILGSAKASQCS